MTRQFSTCSPHPPDGDDGARVWVESPLQMLSAVECFHRGLLGNRADLVPRQGSPSMTRTASELSGLGLPQGLRIASPAGTPPRFPRHGAWGVGDPFSGQVQRRWLFSPPRHDLVLVDDGLATVHLLDLLSRPRPAPIVRARARPTPARVALARVTASRLLAAANAGRLVVFTALAVEDGLAREVSELGVRLVPHDFGWLRSQPSPAAPSERLVVLGTSLVANGLVHAEPYLAWMRELARHGAVAYYPHPREDARTLDRLRAYPGVGVRDLGAPAEVQLRGLGPRHRLLSLPSTAVTSLRLLLAPAGAVVDGLRVPEAWWTSRVPTELRAHLNLTVTGADQGCRRQEAPAPPSQGILPLDAAAPRGLLTP
ncbi:MAG: hypothetical protein ACRDYU_09265 [Actinomycetes bacterium]